MLASYDGGLVVKVAVLEVFDEFVDVQILSLGRIDVPKRNELIGYP